ncbi:hypothetical protein D9757_014620 [Collybiopsis confluens]|uniref:Uncharacterized protein n=1 Tax=Collybiopsis confluens TaxID=2823264 RepID=A0A8H5C9Q7_9AGAR|nr:hypothetical protein D9757_014916 [Collybiopsis confluens]KAF5337714.1 hypothetical protein D9757_014751 [Collybiopsis confluens]KAF5338189.1 hypothetical protein D9757_014620 [Collybiopsis confluens]
MSYHMLNGKADDYFQGMNMPRLPSNAPGGTPGANGVPGSSGAGGMRPPSRAMNPPTAGGGSGGNELVNGYPVPPTTPKHPPTHGTSQMGQVHPQPHQQGNMTPQHHQQHPQNTLMQSTTPTYSLRPDPLKRKASGLESPKMGPPTEIPFHGHNNDAPSMVDRLNSAMQNGVIGGKPPSNNMNFGMGLTRPGTRSGFSPSTPASASTPGVSGQQLENIQARPQSPPPNRPEQLVPIRLEFDVDHHKYRDTFVWNLNDPVVTPEIFAQTVVADYQLAPTYHSTIVKNIQEQLGDYKAHSALYDGEGGEYLGDDSDPSSVERGVLDEKDAIWWENWRKRLRTEHGFVKTGKGPKDLAPDVTNFAGEKSMTVEEFGADECKMIDDMRIIIKRCLLVLDIHFQLDIIVGSMKLDDQFEWDIDNVKVSPEHFAEVYTRDLDLSGEFRTAISHSIREQVQAYQKSLFLVGRPFDGSIRDEDLRSSFLPSLTEGARPMGPFIGHVPSPYLLLCLIQLYSCTVGTTLMDPTNIVTHELETQRARAFTAREMAFNILGPISPPSSLLYHPGRARVSST